VNDLQQSPVECDSGLQCQSFNYFISHILLHMLTLEKLPVDEMTPEAMKVDEMTPEAMKVINVVIVGYIMYDV